KMLLESSESQSFLIEKNGRPVCQLDITPTQHDEMHLSFHTSADDYLLDYILDYRNRQNQGFADVLRFFVSFYYSFPGPGSLYIMVDGRESDYNTPVPEAGFQFCAEVQLNQIPLNLYRIDGIPL
ncbi:MAG: hypothetical protein Q8926_17190, partial [Bacteroidota bacterium]|nr:hypothetical protein [Bacteroidota bacterium]